MTAQPVPGEPGTFTKRGRRYGRGRGIDAFVYEGVCTDCLAPFAYEALALPSGGPRLTPARCASCRLSFRQRRQAATAAKLKAQIQAAEERGADRERRKAAKRERARRRARFRLPAALRAAPPAS